MPTPLYLIKADLLALEQTIACSRLRIGKHRQIEINKTGRPEAQILRLHQEPFSGRAKRLTKGTYVDPDAANSRRKHPVLHSTRPGFPVAVGTVYGKLKEILIIRPRFFVVRRWTDFWAVLMKKPTPQPVTHLTIEVCTIGLAVRVKPSVVYKRRQCPLIKPFTIPFPYVFNSWGD